MLSRCCCCSRQSAAKQVAFVGRNRIVKLWRYRLRRTEGECANLFRGATAQYICVALLYFVLLGIMLHRCSIIEPA